MPRQRKAIPPETLTKIEVHLASGNRILPFSWTEEDKKWYGVFKSRKKDDKRKGQRTASALKQKDPELYAQRREANRAACAKYSSTLSPEVRKKRYKDFDDKRKPQRKVYYELNKEKYKLNANKLSRAYPKLLLSASKREIEVEMTREQVEAKVVLPCHYCGHQLDGHRNGLDRYDNDLHYTDENTVPCCKACNRGKSVWKADEFIDRCEKVAALAGHLEHGSRHPVIVPCRATIESCTFWHHDSTARKRGLENNLTELEWDELVSMPCHYCQTSPCRGIDRLDNSVRSYDIDNCVPCCKGCNVLKWDQDVLHFFDRCARVAEKHRDRVRLACKFE
jgi:hypothetical protein